MIARLKSWFDKERTHGHEVRKKTILTRLKFELEYEVDRQMVLEQHKSPEFCAFALRASQKRLQTFTIVSPTRVQDNWYEAIVLPRIRATARCGQKVTSSSNRKVTEEKHQLSWATSDRLVHLAARGSTEELQLHVARPEEFVRDRAETAVVVLDATAMWFKLRGEDRVYLCDDEQAKIKIKI